MYQMADLPIKIRFLDNNNRPILNRDGDELELLNQWGDNPELATTREEEQYKNILDENGCIIAVEVNPESSREIMASSRELLLLPQIQYRAQIIAGESQSVYEFAFLTSRYANFLHHVHTFIDIAWDHFALLDDPEYEIDAAALEQVLVNSEDEAVKFEQLMMLFDLNPRQLPEQVEVLLVNDGSRSHGLLFESPEPLDWDRLEITLAHVDNSDAVEEFDNKIKIIDASIATTQNKGGPDDYNKQWVDLLFLETGDLSGYTIEHLAINSSDGEAYQKFYTFTGSHIYNAGTLVRIYNGQEPGHAPDDVEPVYLYAGYRSQAFQPAGEIIRLKSADGETQHNRLFYLKETFSEMDVNLVRNQDGTRFFAFFRDGGQESSDLPTGMYRLQFTFKRDIGSEHPVLKRFGFSNAEETFIEFSLPALLPSGS
jgi:hypothetical protein